MYHILKTIGYILKFNTELVTYTENHLLYTEIVYTELVANRLQKLH